jgi:hypothetical protein
MTTVTNGDGEAISASDYKLQPYNRTPKYQIVLLPDGMPWQIASGGYAEAAITLAGVWGYHREYATAWVSIATLAAAISSTSVTTFTCTTGVIKAGDLLKIDSEYIYAVSVATGANDTVTCVRGVNGSTAATHLINSVIYRWTISDEVEMLARQCAAAYYKLRTNPTMDTALIDGVTFVTPKDITAYMRHRLEQLGLLRIGIG